MEQLFADRTTRLNHLSPESREEVTRLAKEQGNPEEYLDKRFVSFWLRKTEGIDPAVLDQNYDQVVEQYFGAGTTSTQAYNRLGQMYKEAANYKPRQKVKKSIPEIGLEGAERLVQSAKKGFYGGLSEVGPSVQRGLATGIYASQEAIASTAPEIKALDKKIEQATTEWLAWQQNQSTVNSDEDMQRYIMNREIIESRGNELSARLQSLMEEKRGIQEEYTRVVKSAQSNVTGYANKLVKAATEGSERTKVIRSAYDTVPKAEAGTWQATIDEYGEALGQMGVFAATGGSNIVLSAAMSDELLKDYARANGKNVTDLSTQELAEAAPLAAFYGLVGGAMERIGVEGAVLKQLTVASRGGVKLTLKEYIQKIAKTAVESGITEGLTEAAQGQLLDVLASASYDPEQDAWSAEAMKQRVKEFLIAGAVGGKFGVVSATYAEFASEARTEQLLNKVFKKGRPLAREDYQIYRNYYTDEQIRKKYGDSPLIDTFIKAINGEETAQVDFNLQNWQVVGKDTVEARTGSTALLERNGQRYIVFTHTGRRMVLKVDPQNESHQRAVQTLKTMSSIDATGVTNVVGSPIFGGIYGTVQMEGDEGGWSVINHQTGEVVAEGLETEQQAKNEAIERFHAEVAAGNEASLREAVESLQQAVQGVDIEVTEEAQTAAELAKQQPGLMSSLVQAYMARHPEVQSPDDVTMDDLAKVKIYGMSVTEIRDNAARRVAKIAKDGDVTTVIEEVSESYIKAAIAADPSLVGRLLAWKKGYEANTGLAKYDDTETGVTEWFSDMTIDYVMTDGGTTEDVASSKRLRELSPNWYQAFVLRVRAYMHELTASAKMFVQARNKGLIKTELENHIRQSLGETNQPPPSTPETARASFQMSTNRLESGFYSKLSTVIESKVQGKVATVQQVKALLSPKYGVKAEEIKWSGIEQAIDTHAVDGKVSKDALLKYLADNGAVRFEEVNLVAARRKETYEDISQRLFGIPFSETTPEQGDAVEKERLDAGERRVADETKYSVYQLPSGENYREVVLAMQQNEEMQQKYERGQISKGELESSRYTTSHFPDIPNYVAHMRLNERTDAEGNDGLFIEEIQSDRHQAGREKGYQGEFNTTGFTAKMDSQARKWIIEKDGEYYTDLPIRIADDSQMALNIALTGDETPGIPDAPFRKEWPLAMFKRALRDAVESGKDWIGWTTGQTQFERWGSERFDWKKNPEGGWIMSGQEQYEGSAGGIDIETAARERVELLEERGKAVRTKRDVYALVRRKLREGKAELIAEKIWTRMQTEDSGTAMPRKEGMEAFYDSAGEFGGMVKEIGKYVKKWGGKVEGGTINGNTPIHKVAITDAMRESVGQGQASFQMAPPTESKAFKDWFGDSKVVDAEGRPLLVYHGSKAKFNIFEFSKENRTAASYGYGFYFTDNKDIALGYKGSDGDLFEVYLSIKKPLNNNAKPFKKAELYKIIKAAVNNEIIESKGDIEDYKDTFLSNIVYTYSTSLYDSINAAVSMLGNNDLAIDQVAELANIIGSEMLALKSVTEATGYDGIYVKDFQGGDDDVYIAWHPNQIKSATSNRGTYSPSDPRITYQIEPIRKEDWEDSIGDDIEIAMAQAFADDLYAKHEAEQREEAARRQKQRLPLGSGGLSKTIRYTMMPIASRIRNISPNLFGRIRRYTYDVDVTTGEYMQRVKPLELAIKKLTKPERMKVYAHLSNGRYDEAEAILGPGSKATLADVRKLLDELYDYAIKNGHEVDYNKGYFPRWVKDLSALYEIIGVEDKSTLRGILQAAAIAKGKDQLTNEEQIQLVNRLLAGTPSNEGISNFKKRRIKEVEPAMFEEAYANPIDAINRYIASVIAVTEKRRLFGKHGVEKRVEVISFGQKDTMTIKNVLDVDQSVGAMVLQEARDADLTAEEIRELRASIMALLETKPTPSGWREIRTLTYLTTMGKGFSSTLTQLQDLVFAMYSGGSLNTAASIASYFGKEELKVAQDLQLDNFQREYADAFAVHSAIADITHKVFTATGLRHFGMAGQQVLINSTIRRYRQAAKSKKGFSAIQRQTLLDYFAGNEVALEQLRKDLQEGKKSTAVKLLGWNILLDYHPAAKSEMPAGYLNHPVGRLWYILKSYTLKMLDTYRREGIREIRMGIQNHDYDRFLRGTSNLIYLGVMLWLAGIGVDYLKDKLLRGIDTEMDDLAVDNVWKLLGIHRYVQYRFHRYGTTDAAFTLLAPPMPWYKYPEEDIKEYIKRQANNEDMSILDLESLRMVPLAGDTLYWWGLPFDGEQGTGQKQAEKIKQKRNN